MEFAELEFSRPAASMLYGRLHLSVIILDISA
jgi:hypothetical protein